MSWRDRLVPGEFKGVPFFTESHEHTGGKRAVVHEYPLRDEPYVEEQGRKAHSFTMEMFVLASAVSGGARGDDYFEQREQLLQALDSPGPGTLIHPYRGSMRVIALDFRQSEGTGKGGYAQFSVTFSEAGRQAEPDASADTHGDVANAADGALAASTDDFTDTHSLMDMPQFVADAAASTFDDLASTLRTINGRAAAVGATLNQVSGAINRFREQLTTLVRTPRDLANDAIGVLVSFSGIARDARASLQGYRGLWRFGDDASTPPTTTPERVQQTTNQQAAHELIQRAAVIQACIAVSEIDFESQTESAELRTLLSDELDRLAEEAPDDVYRALVKLRVATVRDITSRGGDLARVVRYTAATTLPALVIAQHLYGDPTREAEIIARNHVRHPMFVPGGQALEVLSDA